jgi:hypothetical protein
VDIKDRIANALREALKAEFVRLQDEDGVSGFVVSPRFEGLSSIDRQGRIEEILARSLTQQDRRRVLMIAGLTPVEYQAVGARVRIHKVKQLAGGAVEILLHGGLSDAQYVRQALDHQKGVETAEPKAVNGLPLVSLRAKGSPLPLTKEKVIRILRDDPYIEVMSHA